MSQSKLQTIIVLLTWRDSGGYIDMWRFKDEDQPTVHECTTVGFLVSTPEDSDNNSWVLSQSENSDQWGREIAIPAENVTSYQYVKEQSDE